MTSPDYARRNAYDAGKTAAWNWIKEKGKYPLVSEPENPFDFEEKPLLAETWQTAYDETIKKHWRKA